jgi:ribokinase
VTQPRLVILGSINVDLVLAGSPHLPSPGETVVGGRFSTHQGGKGGNQAVAAARALRGGPLDGRVWFVGAVGADSHGRAALSALDDEGIADEACLVRAEAATGVALIVVAADGRNQIAVAPGANEHLDPAAVATQVSRLLADGGVLLASLEVPLAAVEAGLQAAHDAGAVTILNPAPVPAGVSGQDLAARAQVITPNEVEVAALGGPGGLRARHPGLTVITTLGPAGARVDGPQAQATLPAHRVRAVDTTGAGDAFNGVLAAGLLEGRSLDEAAHRAVVAAGLSVTVTGAREGMPLRSAIEAALGV